MKLTVAVPTYNRPRQLARLLDLLLPMTGTMPEVEVIICDNSEGIETKKIVSEHYANAPRLRYQHNERNLEFSGNILQLLLLAKGDYVYFHSDDDCILPDTLHLLLDSIARHVPKVIYLNSHVMQDKEKVGYAVTYCYPRETIITNDGEAFFGRFGLGFISSVALQRKAALKYVGSVKVELHSAHIEIGARIAMDRSVEPCVFIGQASVAASRSFAGRAHTFLNQAFICTPRVYKNLVLDGFMSEPKFKAWLERFAWDGMPNCICWAISERALPPQLERSIGETYHETRCYRYMIRPLLYTPRVFIITAYKSVKVAKKITKAIRAVFKRP